MLKNSLMSLGKVFENFIGLEGYFKHGELHHIECVSTTVSGHDAEKYLRRFGIDVYCRSASDDMETTIYEHNGLKSTGKVPMISFKVNRRQAKHAEYLLCTAGVLISSPMANPNNRKYYHEVINGTRTKLSKCQNRRQKKSIGAILIAFLGLDGTQSHYIENRLESKR